MYLAGIRLGHPGNCCTLLTKCLVMRHHCSKWTVHNRVSLLTWGCEHCDNWNKKNTFRNGQKNGSKTPRIMESNSITLPPAARISVCNPRTPYTNKDFIIRALPTCSPGRSVVPWTHWYWGHSAERSYYKGCASILYGLTLWGQKSLCPKQVGLRALGHDMRSH